MSEVNQFQNIIRADEILSPSQVKKFDFESDISRAYTRTGYFEEDFFTSVELPGEEKEQKKQVGAMVYEIKQQALITSNRFFDASGFGYTEKEPFFAQGQVILQVQEAGDYAIVRSGYEAIEFGKATSRLTFRILPPLPYRGERFERYRCWVGMAYLEPNKSDYSAGLMLESGAGFLDLNVKDEKSKQKIMDQNGWDADYWNLIAFNLADKDDLVKVYPRIAPLFDPRNTSPSISKYLDRVGFATEITLIFNPPNHLTVAVNNEARRLTFDAGALINLSNKNPVIYLGITAGISIPSSDYSFFKDFSNSPQNPLAFAIDKIEYQYIYWSRDRTSNFNFN